MGRAVVARLSRRSDPWRRAATTRRPPRARVVAGRVGGVPRIDPQSARLTSVSSLRSPRPGDAVQLGEERHVGTPMQRSRALARRQHSVFVGTQLAGSGVTRRMLQRRVASGRLTVARVRTSTSSEGRPSTWEGKLLGLVLSAGEGAVVVPSRRRRPSGVSSGYRPGIPELHGAARAEVPPRRRWSVHESTDLDRCGIRRALRRLPLTDPARTLLDLAATHERSAGSRWRSSRRGALKLTSMVRS